MKIRKYVALAGAAALLPLALTFTGASASTAKPPGTIEAGWTIPCLELGKRVYVPNWGAVGPGGRVVRCKVYAEIPLYKDKFYALAPDGRGEYFFIR
jgi:hypothetical protein